MKRQLLPGDQNDEYPHTEKYLRTEDYFAQEETSTSQENSNTLSILMGLQENISTSIEIEMQEMIKSLEKFRNKLPCDPSKKFKITYELLNIQFKNPKLFTDITGIGSITMDGMNVVDPEKYIAWRLKGKVVSNQESPTATLSTQELIDINDFTITTSELSFLEQCLEKTNTIPQDSPNTNQKENTEVALNKQPTPSQRTYSREELLAQFSSSSSTTRTPNEATPVTNRAHKKIAFKMPTSSSLQNYFHKEVIDIISSTLNATPTQNETTPATDSITKDFTSQRRQNS